MPAPEKAPHSVSSSNSRSTENRRRGRWARRRRRRRGLDLSEGAVKLYVMGRIAAAAVVGAALAALVAARPGLAAAGDLQPAVPNVPQKLPDPFAVMLFENRSGVQGLN